MRIRQIVDDITIQMPIKENYQRIFLNNFYDMTGNYDRKRKSNTVTASVDLAFQKYPTGMDASGIMLQYMKSGSLTYSLKISNINVEADMPVSEALKPPPKVSKAVKGSYKADDNKPGTRAHTIKEYVIDSSTVTSYALYAGSPADLFAEYTAELNAEENVARTIAREFYYQAIISIRLHLLRCRKVKSVLESSRYYVFANDQTDISEIDFPDKKLEEIDLKNLKKIDYLVYDLACSIA